MAVVISLTGATATTSSVTVNLMNNTGNYTLASNQGIVVAGSFSFSTLSVTTHSVKFGVAPQSSFEGSISLDVVPTPSTNTPVIEINNITVDTATVTYPTEDGPVTQVLTPGQPMPLTGYTPD